jgi:hypothetical protein
MIIGLLLLPLVGAGCSNLDIPKTAFSSVSRPYQGVDSNYDGGQSAVSQPVYHAVRQARSENAVVLQVIGDDEPVRVLPLPAAGARSVYISELLTQTGVLQKLDYIDATLYRHSTDSIGGIPMEVRMNEDRDGVRPESDYALQAGDRVTVSKAAHPAMQSLVNAILGF